MGKKITIYGSSSSSASKRVASICTANTSPSRAQVAQGNCPTPSHAINKCDIQFDDQEHISRYELVASRKISEPKYIDGTFLASISLLNYINEIFEVVG